MNRIALAAAGVLFLLYPALRPWEDESTVEGATKAMSSDLWVVSHTLAMIGFILVPLGLLAIDRRSAIVFWIGAGLVLPYYGAEAFALNVIAKNGKDVLALAEAFRYGAIPATLFAAGLVTLAVGAIMAALKYRDAWLFAVGFALFLPQFFTPPAIRIAHGALVAVGLIYLAYRESSTQHPRVLKSGRG